MYYTYIKEGGSILGSPSVKGKNPFEALPTGQNAPTAYGANLNSIARPPNNSIAQTASKEQQPFGNLAYNVKDYRAIKDAKQTLSSSIDKAKKEDNKSLVRRLTIMKKAFENFEERLLNNTNKAKNINEPLFVGDVTQVEAKRNADKANASFYKNFNNDEVEGLTHNIKDTGAKKFLNIIEDQNSTAQQLLNVFEGKNTSLQLSVLQKVREIFGNKLDDDFKKIYLNNLFTDISTKNGTGRLDLKLASQKLNTNIAKDDAFAKELFSTQELLDIKKQAKVIELLSRTASSTNSKSALSNSIADKVASLIPIPGVGFLRRFVGEQFNIIKLRNNLSYQDLEITRNPLKYNAKITNIISKLANTPQNYKGN
jgi:hypothetical protein